jgi:pyridoxal phosphate enzyme (YggS family)
VPTTFPELPARVAEIRGRIAEAVARGGHAQAVRLIAVTKTHGPEAVAAAWAAGITDVGENKVQEAIGKQEALADAPCTRGGVRWHLIGHLQSNKAKALPHFALFHALDRESILVAADAVGCKATAVIGAGANVVVAPQPLHVLLQVNISGEDTKGGYALADVPAVAVHRCAGLSVRGVMTMAPFDAPESVLRHVFQGARAARESLVAAGHPATELSMGMSGDYEIAVEEGATLVRLGTVLFGERGRPV